jgi:hypothetical protein
LATAAQRPKAIRAEWFAGAPEVIAGEIHVLPAERCDMGEQRVGNLAAAAAQGVEGASGAPS